MWIALKYFQTTNTNLGKKKRAPSASLSLPFYNYLQQFINLQQLPPPSQHHGEEQVSHHHNCFIFMFKELLSPLSFTSMVIEMNNNSKNFELLLSPSLSWWWRCRTTPNIIELLVSSSLSWWWRCTTTQRILRCTTTRSPSLGGRVKWTTQKFSTWVLLFRRV